MSRASLSPKTIDWEAAPTDAGSAAGSVGSGRHRSESHDLLQEEGCKYLSDNDLSRQSTALWSRSGRIGLEIGRLDSFDEGHRLSGTALYRGQGGAVELRYRVDVDDHWRTREATLELDDPKRFTRRVFESDGAGSWKLDGEPLALDQACDDIDFAFTPATNTLAIRRLDLAVGEEATAQVLWVAVPSFKLKCSRQRYSRLDKSTYRYQGSVGSYKITVDKNGWVLDYPGGGWTAEAHTGPKYR